MPNVPLSPETERRLYALFPESTRTRAAGLLVAECGDNLPFAEGADSGQLERIRFAVLKLSEGRLETLEKMIHLAQIDDRDVLVAAGFGRDVGAHQRWFPQAGEATNSVDDQA